MMTRTTWTLAFFFVTLLSLPVRPRGSAGRSQSPYSLVVEKHEP